MSGGAAARAARCPACAGELSAWRSVPGGEPSDERRYPLLRCERCGSAVTGGDPPSPESYEHGIYASREPRAGRAVRGVQRMVGRQPVHLLGAAGLAATTRAGGEDTPARVLDAGAGGGRLVEALRGAGYDAAGIEPSERGAERTAAAGLPVARAAIEDHEDSGLDAVVMWHVLEHLDDPRAALARVHSWLRPGGVLLVGVPNISSWQARIAGPRWFHLDAPRHRVHFTPAGVEAVLAATGFEPPRLHHLVWEHNPSGMWMALLSGLGMSPGFPFHLLKRNAPHRPLDLALFVVGVPLLPVAVALEAAAGAAGHGGTIAAVATRR